MNNLSFIEILVVASSTIQFVALFLSIFLYLHFPRSTRRPFLWLSASFFLVILRRMFAMVRFSGGFSFGLEIEYGITLLVSILWIMFLVEFMKNTNGKYFDYGTPRSK